MMKIDITDGGPYIVSGGVPLVRIKIVADEKGESIGWEETYRYPDKETYALCRCGQSSQKPFCDGAHATVGFRGEEVAPHIEYAEEARITQGDGIKLYDAPRLCVGARFCDRLGGAWALTANSKKPEFKEIAIQEAMLCPSGRLVMALDATGEKYEPELEPSIALIEDPVGRVSGPIWVRGNIPIYGSDGEPYEVRNRMTLCRCGQSRDLPFCDGTHARTHFDDGHVQG